MAERPRRRQHRERRAKALYAPAFLIDGYEQGGIANRMDVVDERAQLRDVPIDHRLACDEVFGPVLSAMPFEDEADAIRIANASDFGLVAGVWTQDGGRQLRMARAIQTGQVFVNNYGAGGGVELPFGGVKHSGYGREKGFEALHGFTTLKTVVLRHG